jgi:hypothetical protein
VPAAGVVQLLQPFSRALVVVFAEGQRRAGCRLVFITCPLYIVRGCGARARARARATHFLRVCVHVEREADTV